MSPPPPPSLLIDQRSAAVTLSAEAVVEWGRDQQVFVSSLITDMPDERQAVREAIEECGAVPVMFEDLGGQDVSADRAYLAGVRRSTIYVGLFGNRYGVRMPDGYSATHAEFREAEKEGLRLCVFVNGEGGSDMDGSQRDLIAGTRNLYTTTSWSSIEDLKMRVKRRLMDLAAEEISPWVRVGRVILRAREVLNNGETVTVSADVRSAVVHAELVRLRDGRQGDIEWASPSDARPMEFGTLSSTSTTTTLHAERFTLHDRGRGQSGGAMQYSTGGLSWEEISKRALADGLFGTSELGDLQFGVSAHDPLAPIRDLDLDDTIVRPLSRLLITEYLLRSGIAVGVDQFRLGPRHGGGRQLWLTWRPKGYYGSAVDSEPLTVEGLVTDL